MKAWLLVHPAGLSHMHQCDVPDPTPGPGEVCVRVLLAALNPADHYLAIGQYPTRATFPHILGRDGIGIVDCVGAGVTSFSPGDRALLLRSEVGVNRPGMFADKAIIPVESLTKPPEDWTDGQAAAAPLVYLTAHQALSQWGQLPPSVVLITGASGGVGVASVQLAAAAGHKVIALSRSEKKREILKSLGAAICLDPEDAHWPDQLKKQLGKRRVDLAIDNIGGAGFSQLISVLDHAGKVSVVGRLAGPVPEFNTSTLLFRRIRIGGVHVGDYKPAEAQAAWSEMVSTLNRTAARPLIDSVFAFDQLLDAFQKLARGPMGKVLLRVGS